jgi:hypothetical protein
MISLNHTRKPKEYFCTDGSKIYNATTLNLLLIRIDLKWPSKLNEPLRPYLQEMFYAMIKPPGAMVRILPVGGSFSLLDRGFLHFVTPRPIAHT